MSSTAPARRLRIVVGVAAVSLSALLGFVARAAQPGPRSALASRSTVVTSEDSSRFFADHRSRSSVGPAGGAVPSIWSGGS